jgi:CRISPR-associated protein Cas2
MINLLVTYDVNTLTKEGRRRLRRVAKICEGFGQRVQLSVFEISVSETQKEILRHRLKKAIDPKLDSLRIYTLAGSRTNVVESYGRDLFIDYTEPLIV